MTIVPIQRRANQVPYPRGVRSTAVGLLLLAGLLAASGCSGNSSSKPGIGAITFTNATGTPMTALKQLSAGESTYVEVPVTNDPAQLGADWSSYCGSAPPVGTPVPPGQTEDQTCGTFTPGHTLSGPIPAFAATPTGYITLFTAPAAVPKGGLVTLTATATSDRAQTATVAITIAAQAVSIQLAPAPPASLNTGATARITAVVNNDVLNGGVSWSVLCGSTDCGSFAPAQTGSGAATTYTAPAAVPIGSPVADSTTGTVQITATSVTDPTKFVNSLVLIAAPTGNTPASSAAND